MAAINCGSSIKKIKFEKPHPAIRSVAEKGCCGKGVEGNVLQNDVCRKAELRKGGDCRKVKIVEEQSCGSERYLS